MFTNQAEHYEHQLVKLLPTPHFLSLHQRSPKTSNTPSTHSSSSHKHSKVLVCLLNSLVKVVSYYAVWLVGSSKLWENPQILHRGKLDQLDSECLQPKNQEGHILHHKFLRSTTKFCLDCSQSNSIFGRAHYFLTHLNRSLQEDAFEMKKGIFGMFFKVPVTKFL